MPKAYSYTRFSTPEQAKGDSYRRQTQRAKEYADKHGLELDESLSYHDAGVSAFRGANAETGKLGEFLAAVHSGKVPEGSFLLIENLDRLSRDSIVDAQTLFLSIITQNIIIVTVDDHKQYSRELINKSPYLIFEAVISLIRANDESAAKSRRLAGAWENKRAKASTKPLTSKVPGWLHYNKQAGIIEVIEERAEIVRRIFTEYLGGRGQERIASNLNKDGIEPWGVGKQKAKQINKSYVTKVLNNPAVIGEFTPHRKENKKRVPLAPIPNYYPPVITQDDFIRVQETQSAGGMRGKKSAPMQNIFSTLATCPFCHSTMTRTNKGKNREYLVCSKAKVGGECLYHTINYFKAEALLLRTIEILQVPMDEDRLSKITTEKAQLNDAIDQDMIWLDRYKTFITKGLYRPEDNHPRGMDVLMGPLVDTPYTILNEMQLLEQAITSRNAVIEKLNREYSLSQPILINSRLEELKELIKNGLTEIEPVNAKLRELCSKIVFDYEHEKMILHYKHTELVSEVPFPESRLRKPLQYEPAKEFFTAYETIDLD